MSYLFVVTKQTSFPTLTWYFIWYKVTSAKYVVYLTHAHTQRGWGGFWTDCDSPNEKNYRTLSNGHVALVVHPTLDHHYHRNHKTLQSRNKKTQSTHHSNQDTMYRQHHI